jgi:hypothetical protein
MPATVGMPWHRADHEQYGDHDEYSNPPLPSSHGLTSVLTRLCPGDTLSDVTAAIRTLDIILTLPLSR